MKQETRTKNSTRNIVFSMLAYFLQVVLGFLVRRYFIFYFNAEYLGLNSLFSNVLSMLSLAEAGFGTAIVFAMYKPMAEGDNEKVKQLLWYYKRCYAIIGVIIFCCGLFVLPFMNYFKTKAPNVDVNLYIVYLIFLLNTVITYFFSYRRSLLYVSQRNDIESKINFSINILQTICQLLVVFFVKNYYLYIFLIGIFSLINNIVVLIITNKFYPEFIKRPICFLNKEEKKSILKNIRAMIYHKIGEIVVFGTDSLIIYVMLGSLNLGMYSNYLLITTYISSFITIFTNSIRGSVGNSIAKESIERNKNLLNKLNFILFFILSFCTICIFVLADSFIDVILTVDKSTNLLLDNSVLILLCVSFYFTQSRNIVGLFKECCGLFRQNMYVPIIEAFINLVSSIALVYFMGLPGVVLGTIISTITTCLWVEPFILNKYYFKGSTLKYFEKYLLYTLCMCLVGILSYYVCSLIVAVNLISLLIKFVVCGSVTLIGLFATMCWFPEFKICLNWGKEIIKTVFKK